MDSTKQLSLFGEASAPYVADSPTSKAAAEDIEPDLNRLQSQVLAHIRVCGFHGATDEELCTALEMNPSTLRPRRVELSNRFLIVKVERTRPTRSGRQAQVWVAQWPGP